MFDKKKCEDLKNILKSARDQLEEGEEASTKKKKKNARETHKPKYVNSDNFERMSICSHVNDFLFFSQVIERGVEVAKESGAY